MNTSIFYANESSFFNKFFLFDNLVLASDNVFLLQLLQSWYLYVFVLFLWFFQKLDFSSTWKNLFQNYILHLILAVYSYQCMVLTKLLDWIYDNFIQFCGICFNTNPWFSACFKLLMRITCYWTQICTIGHKLINLSNFHSFWKNL